MAKKHFHGRRHVRAQWRVSVIRLKKRERKLFQSLTVLKRFMNHGLVHDVQNALINLTQGITNLLPIVRAAVESSISFPFPPEAKERFIKQIREIQGEMNESNTTEG